MYISCIGALISRSSLYSYRSWEYEKIDAIDPIDIIGATIFYFIYGSFILKVGPLYSTFNSVWCTNKVRHSVDYLNIVKFFSYIYILYSIYVNRFTYNESVVGLGNMLYF